MKRTLSEGELQAVLRPLAEANDRFARRYPGESTARQPVHTVYGGAHLFKADAGKKLGSVALRTVEQYAPNFAAFARALELPGHADLPYDPEEIGKLSARSLPPSHPAWLALNVYGRMLAKLQSEAVEDYRIDFEDGYGVRADAEEDGHALTAAAELAKGMQEDSLPPFIGIRIKPFSEESNARAVRTLDIVMTKLTELTGKRLPENFVVNLPKVAIPEQVKALAQVFELLEEKLALEKGILKMEIMIESPRLIVGHGGQCIIPALIHAARGRCLAAHFGAYDYTSSLNITAAHQSLDHPSCDFAREAMHVSLAGTGVWLSDGATNEMPVGPHRARQGEKLTSNEMRENTLVVHRAWKRSFADIRHSLRQGFFQGWDLHPGQIPVRYAAMYCFVLENLVPATVRLKSFIEKAAQASLVGNVFDDAATAQGLLNFFLRATNCGAIGAEEVEASGLTLEEIQTRSFAAIIEARSQSPQSRK